MTAGIAVVRTLLMRGECPICIFIPTVALATNWRPRR
jgi:hypothetical protein